MSAADTGLSPAAAYKSRWNVAYSRKATTMEATIEVAGLRKRFGPTVAEVTR